MQKYFITSENRAVATLPTYIKVNGLPIRINTSSLKDYDILILKRAVPDAGKVITKSHGELINGQWVEVIDEQLTSEEIIQAAALSKNIFTKLQIRRAMRELGNENALDTVLTSNPSFQKDWTDAIEIDLNDTMTKMALQSMSIDVDAIKIKIAEQENNNVSSET